MEIEQVMVTPALAEQMLGKNTSNRNVRVNHVATLARDMEAGNWQMTGDPLRLSDDGSLLDGQHRLLAIVRAGVTVEMIVITGLPNSTQAMMDTGARRSFSDVLHLRGYSNSRDLAAIVKKRHAWLLGAPSNSRNVRPSHSELLAVLDMEADLLVEATTSARRWSRIDLPRSSVGVAWLILQEIDREDADFFFSRLADGQNLGEGDAIYALRRLIERSPKEVFNRNAEKYVMGLLFKTWNKFRSGESASIIRYNIGGSSPEPFPHPL